jgi:hypothetical protein
MTVPPGWVTFFWGMKCNCGAPNCRRVVRSIARTPRSAILWHARRGGLQDYMRAMLPLAPQQ